jgi:hypothetical protein
MALSGAAVAYATVGGLVLYSGIKGATLSDTFKSVLTGNLNLQDTETVQFGSSSSSGSGSSVSADSGSASQNYITIANYLVQNGYSKTAAAGICGCIAGESGGNPEAMEGGGSGGGGLIQWTPISAYPGLVTGNATKDLDAQLPAIIAYNNVQGPGLVAMLNAQTSPVAAADFYSQYFERPAVTDSDVRASVANSVYAAITSGSTSGTVTTTNGSTQYTSPNGYSY